MPRKGKKAEKMVEKSVDEKNDVVLEPMEEKTEHSDGNINGENDGKIYAVNEPVENTEDLTEQEREEPTEDSPEENTEAEQIVFYRPRRRPGEHSVYPIKGGKLWGFCMQFSNAGKELRKCYGNKLRYLQTAKTYGECLEKLAMAVGKMDELLQEKLKKLGYKPEEDEGQ